MIQRVSKILSPLRDSCQPPERNSWSATPFPASIGLYQAGQGYPDFDEKKAQSYFEKVTRAVTDLIKDTIRRWDAAGV